MYSILEKLNGYLQKNKRVWAAGFIFILASVIGLLMAFQGGDVNGSAHDMKKDWKQLLDSKNTMHLHWLRTLNPLIRETQGDLIWNSSEQRGIMRFVNLPRLNRGQRYLLWIYDLNRPSQEPVKAAEFDVGRRNNGEYYIPFKAKQSVTMPYKFLVTLGNKDTTHISRQESLLLAQP